MAIYEKTAPLASANAAKQGPFSNGRTLKAGTGNGPPVIQDWQLNNQLAFASTIAEPSRAPACIQSLLATLRQREREVRDTVVKLFGIPALLAAEQKLLAERRRLIGTRALRDDRGKRRLVQGDGRAAMMAAGAA